jgi:hypothetical protein
MRLLAPSIVASLALASAASAAPRTAAHQTLFFDAVPTLARSAGPPGHRVGHEQIASGILRDARGHAIGRFAFTCRTTAVLAADDVRERCTGWGRTAEGRIRVAGASRESDATHGWRIAGGTSAYDGARGTLLLRDIGEGETLVTVSVAPRSGVVLHTAAVGRPAANNAFRARADALCARAAGQLAALPPFPFSSFDPLHPDPALLPQVGQFFTGAHDPRPTLAALNARLRALGQPPADRGGWARVLAARTASLAVNTEQDEAALSADAAAFVKSVHDVNTTFRAVGITATVFGVGRCIL